MEKRAVLYFSGETSDLDKVSDMLRKPEHEIQCVSAIANSTDIEKYLSLVHKIFGSDVVGQSVGGLVSNLRLTIDDPSNGLSMLKWCRHSTDKKVANMPMLLIVNDPETELSRRQMQEIRDYQFGLLYKPRFDGRHIVQLLFH